MNGRVPIAVSVALVVAGCIENTSPGNDREAELSSPRPAAETMAVGQALAGVASSLLHPQTMTDADLASLPVLPGACRFRMTKVGAPVLVHGSEAVLKLNDRLVKLPSNGAGRYEADGVTVAVRDLDERNDTGESFAAEFVLWLPGARNELGFHGFSRCER
jgi:hypothetical protein